MTDNSDIVPRVFKPVRMFFGGRVYQCVSCGVEIYAAGGKTLREQAADHLLGSMRCSTGSAPEDVSAPSSSRKG